MVEIDSGMPCMLEKGRVKRKSVSMEVEDGNANEMENVKLIEDERAKQGEVSTITVSLQVQT